MKAGRIARSVVAIVVLIAAVLTTAVAIRAADEALKAGTYTAKVKAIVCRGCPPVIKKTIEGLKPIESATVDQKTSTVEFTVRKDATIKLAEIQTALKAAADKMGMGADYTLSEVKPKGH